MRSVPQFSRLILVILSFAVLLLTGCAGSDSTPTGTFTANQVSGKTFAYSSSGSTGTLAFNADGTWSTTIASSTFSGTWSITSGKLVCVTTTGGNHTITYTLLETTSNSMTTSFVEVNPADPNNPVTGSAVLAATFTTAQVSGKTFAYASGASTGTLAFNADGTWSTTIGTSTFSGTWSVTSGKLVCVTTSGGNHTLTYTALVSDDTKAIHTNVVEVNPADPNNPVTYTATLTAVYTIAGKVSQTNTGLAGVTIALDGDQTLTATTDADGTYRFTVPAGEYRVTPSKVNATFAPLDNNFAVRSANVGAVDFASVAPKAGPNTNKWILTGSLVYPRSGHTATGWQSGRVLVAGGYNSTSGLLNQAEIYDSMAGTWSIRGHMINPRRGHTATMLQGEGKVLFAGGQGNTISTSASAEIYHLSSFSPTGFMKYDRIGHTATILPNWKVLVTGGGDVAGNSRASAEIYDPETGTWTLTGSMKYDRIGHTAILLINGKVLVAGGRDTAGNSRASAELYDPETGTWTQTGSLNFGRTLFTATVLNDGIVLVAGGADLATLDARASAELYDPATGKWTQTGSLNQKRLMHTASRINGKVLVAGGSFTGIQQYLVGQPSRIETHVASAEIYDPVTRQWTQTGSLNYERSGHTATTIGSLSESILITGGYSRSENQDIYRATSEWFSQ